MSREELINAILGFRPAILSAQEANALETDTLEYLYKMNCNLSFYTLTKKITLISVILAFYGNNNAKVPLLMRETSEVLDLYLNEIRNISKIEFDSEFKQYCERREAEAVENEDDLYFGSTDKEKKLGFYESLYPTDAEIINYVEGIISGYQAKITAVKEEITQENADLSENESSLDGPLRYDQRSELIEDIKRNRHKLLELKEILEHYTALEANELLRLELLQSDSRK